MENFNYKNLIRIFNDLSEYEINFRNRFFPGRVYKNASKWIRDSNSYEIINGRVHVGSNILGDGTSRKFIEYIETGKVSKLDEYINEYGELFKDKSYNQLTKVHGIGEVKAKEIINSLGNITLDEFISILPNIGEKIPGTNITYTEMMSTGIQLLKLTNGERLPWIDANKLANSIIYSAKNKTNIDFYVYKLGSLRRHKNTVGDIDLVISNCELNDFNELKSLFHNELDHILVNGESKIAGIKNGFQVDIRFIDTKYLGCHILHGTGSQEFNIKMRALAKSKNMRLNEYCIINDNKEVYFDKEEDVFTYLGIDYVRPEYR